MHKSQIFSDETERFIPGHECDGYAGIIIGWPGAGTKHEYMTSPANADLGLAYHDDQINTDAVHYQYVRYALDVDRDVGSGVGASI